jgi:ribonuclease HI
MTNDREEELEQPVRWSPPAAGRYKVNWDIAVHQSIKNIGVGVIVRDYRGEIHATLSKKIKSLHEPVMAEALGALVAAEFCKDLGLPDIDLEGDSLLVVRAIKDSSAQWATYGHIVDDVKVVLNRLRS